MNDFSQGRRRGLNFERWGYAIGRIQITETKACYSLEMRYYIKHPGCIFSLFIAVYS